MLKFAVIAPAARLAQWQVAAVDKLQAEGLARLELVVYEDLGEPEQLGLLSRVQRLLARPAKGACAVPADSIWPDVARGYDAGAAAHGDSLDFVLDFGSGDLPLADLPPARLGRWLIRFGEADDAALDKPGFWEVYQDRPTTRVSLVRQSPQGNALLKEARQKTRRSWRANTAAILALAAELPRLGVLDPHRAEHAPASVAAAPAAGGARRSGLALGLRFLLGQCSRYLRWIYAAITYVDHWAVLIFRKSDFQAGRLSREAAVAQVFFPKWQGFAADPFVVESEGKLHLLFEYYCYRTRQGRIDLVTYDHDLEVIDYVPSYIEDATHLSYPSVLRLDAGFMILPEAGCSGSVKYWTVPRLGQQPRPAGALIEDFEGLDSTVVHVDGRYWMFNTSLTDPEGRLYLWSADHLLGPWAPHRQNPVKIDITGARPGGDCLVSEQGELLRPGQDGSLSYGGSLVFHRVSALGDHAYEEVPAFRIGPEDVAPDARGVHHFSASENYVAIDYKVRRFRFRWLNLLSVDRTWTLPREPRQPARAANG